MVAGQQMHLDGAAGSEVDGEEIGGAGEVALDQAKDDYIDSGGIGNEVAVTYPNQQQDT